MMKTFFIRTAGLLLLVLFFSRVFAVNVTFRVDMSLQTVPPEGVHIAGTFQGWDPAATPMSTPGGSVYTYSQDFNAGETIEYKFINGDAWGEDESVPAACAQNGNRYLVIPENDTVLMAVCFGACGPCGSPVQATFRVDMSEQTVSGDGVHVAGNFQGWNPASSPMTAIGNGIYEYVTTLSAGQYLEFKYINGNAWSGEELVPPACGVSNGMGGYNRFFTLPNSNYVFSTVCFSSCNPCGYVPVPVDVTFTVDLSEQTVSADGIHIAGTFQGWDPAATPLENMGNNLYSVTLTLQSNDYHQYKFVNGIEWAAAESVPPECGVDDGQGGFNRYFTVPEVNTELPEVCFSSCTPCGVGIGENKQTGSDLNINPNPVKGIAGVSFLMIEPGDASLIIYDLNGRIVKNLFFSGLGKGLNNTSFSSAGWMPGLYMVRLLTHGNGWIGNDHVRIIVE